MENYINFQHSEDSLIISIKSFIWSIEFYESNNCVEKKLNFEIINELEKIQKRISLLFTKLILTCISLIVMTLIFTLFLRDFYLILIIFFVVPLIILSILITVSFGIKIIILTFKIENEKKIK